MKYRVDVPGPSAKRMEGHGKLFIVLHDGWEGDQLVQVIPDSVGVVPGVIEIEVPDHYEWSGSTSINDGLSFDVYVEWANSTGSRTVKAYLMPEKHNVDVVGQAHESPGMA